MRDRVFIKLLLVIFCIWLWVLAGAILAPLLYFLLTFKDFWPFLMSEKYQALYLISPILLGVTAILLIITSVFGCFGTAMTNKCILLIFNTLLVASILTHISGASIFMIFQDEISEHVTGSMRKQMESYGTDESIKNRFATIQENLKCCGTDSYTDWTELSFAGITINYPPQTCCIEQGCLASIDSNVYKTGCAERMGSTIEWISILSLAIAVIVTFMEVYGFILSFILICKPEPEISKAI